MSECPSVRPGFKFSALVKFYDHIAMSVRKCFSLLSYFLHASISVFLLYIIASLNLAALKAENTHIKRIIYACERRK